MDRRSRSKRPRRRVGYGCANSAASSLRRSRVLTLEDIHKSYGENFCLQRRFTLPVERGRKRRSWSGPNGAGKSTLLRDRRRPTRFRVQERALTGPQRGQSHSSHSTNWRSSMPAEPSWRNSHRSLANRRLPAAFAATWGRSCFSGDDVKKRVSVLSGGEKGAPRTGEAVASAAEPASSWMSRRITWMSKPARSSRQALREFSGTLLFVSHDRSFINALTTRVIDVQRVDTSILFPGNYDDFHSRKRTDSSPKNRQRRQTLRGNPTAPSSEKSQAAALARGTPASDEAGATRSARRIERLEGDILENEEQPSTRHFNGKRDQRTPTVIPSGCAILERRAPRRTRSGLRTWLTANGIVWPTNSPRWTTPSKASRQSAHRSAT